MDKPNTPQQWALLLDCVARAVSLQDLCDELGNRPDQIRRWLRDHPDKTQQAAHLALYELSRVTEKLRTQAAHLDYESVRDLEREADDIAERWVIRYWSHYPANNPGRYHAFRQRKESRKP